MLKTLGVHGDAAGRHDGGRPMTDSTSASDIERTFRHRWWFATVAGFFLGHLAFSLIGHGITWPHGDELTWAQYTAHTAGLLAVAAIVFVLQRAAIRPHITVTSQRMVLGAATLIAGFWLGAETVGPPADYLIGFTILGSALWIGAAGWRGILGVWNIAGVLSFPIGLAVGMVVVPVAIRAGLFDPESPSLLHHTIGWLLGSTTTAVVGGYLSGWPLAHLFVRRAAVPAQQQLPADGAAPRR